MGVLLLFFHYSLAVVNILITYIIALILAVILRGSSSRLVFDYHYYYYYYYDLTTSTCKCILDIHSHVHTHILNSYQQNIIEDVFKVFVIGDLSTVPLQIEKKPQPLLVM